MRIEHGPYKANVAGLLNEITDNFVCFEELDKFFKIPNASRFWFVVTDRECKESCKLVLGATRVFVDDVVCNMTAYTDRELRKYLKPNKTYYVRLQYED